MMARSSTGEVLKEEEEEEEEELDPVVSEAIEQICE